MKKMTVYYDTKVQNSIGKWSAGETCMDIDVEEGRAEILTGEYWRETVVYEDLERLLQITEELKGRFYISGSIKKIEVVSE